MMASAVAYAQVDPPTVRQSRNGEFMTRYYPPTARSRGEQGKVSFQIGIDKDGFLNSCEVTQSSGFKNLDRETCDFLTKYAKIKPARGPDGRAVATTQQGYMNWKLPPGSRRMAMADSPTSLDPDKQICRRYVRTGSKASFVKMCMTAQEWAEKDRLNKEETRRLQDVGGGCPQVGGCLRR
jgi:TonB family protein